MAKTSNQVKKEIKDFISEGIKTQTSERWEDLAIKVRKDMMDAIFRLTEIPENAYIRE